MSPRTRSLLATLLTIALAAVVVWGVVAGITGGGERDRVRALTSRLRCPVCQGESVADSPSESARDIAALVEQQVQAGWTDAQVEQYFVERYGAWVLLDPPRSGSTLLLWAVPLVAVTGGAVAVVSRLERGRRRTVLVATAAVLGLGSTAVLVVAGARERTPRDPVALGAEPDGGAARDLAAVTNEEMEVVIARNPNVVGMRLALVERYLDEGDVENALRHTSVAINLPATDQEYERALRLHGWVSALSGAPASGAQYLRAALTLSPDDRDALWFLANVEFFDLGNPVAAHAALTALMDLSATAPMTDAQRAQVDALAAQVDAALAAGQTTPGTAPGTTPGTTQP